MEYNIRGSVYDIPSDETVIAFQFFKEHQDLVEIEGGSAAELFTQLQHVMEQVVMGQAQEAEPGSTVEAQVLLDEWCAAHPMRTLWETGEQPVGSMAIADQVLDLWDAALAAQHPALQNIPHLAKQASKAAREDVAAVKGEVEERCSRR